MEAAAVVLENDAIIGSVVFNGFAVQDAGAFAAVPALIMIGRGSVGQLVLGAVNSENIQAGVPAEMLASVGSVCGTGVLATRWEFPDAVMADGVPYLSASTGLPSIKVGGVVEPYTA
jgi:hypothetical protein